MFDGPLPEYESETVRDLRAARTLVFRGWCKGTLARDGAGVSCSHDFVDATRFCMVGAISRVSGSQKQRERLAREIGREINGNIVTFNDDCATRWTHVLGVFDAVIERLKARDATAWKRKLARKVKRVEEMAHV